MKRIKYIILSIVFFAIPAVAFADAIPATDFENGTLSGWDIGSQQGTFSGNIITGDGTGVSIASSTVTFNAPGNIWTFSPYGTSAALLQPNGNPYNSPPGAQSFDDAMTGLGLSPANNIALRDLLQAQAEATGNGQGNPTDASWITKNVTLTAGTVYTMSWNYIGTDYVPFNDGSITSLIPVDSSSSAIITVNNQVSNYALLGFTNPGTGDYSTGSYASTGWQISTYEVSVTGDYKLGFAVFNLDDYALSPVLLIDNQPGATTKNGESFGAVAPNNPDAPTIPPTTTEPPATDPPATDPPVTDPSATDPPATDPPATDPPATDPPATDPPATDPPTTEPEETTTTTERPRRPRPRPTTTTTTTIPVAVQTTTTQPDIVVPPTTTPIDGGSELPKTGNGITMFYVGLISTVIGYSILTASNKRKVK